LFSEFRDLVGLANGKTAEHHMGLFSSYAEVYSSFESFPRGTREGEFFYRLAELEMTTAFPLLLEVFKRFSSLEHRSEREAIMADLESYFVRRTVCQLSTRSYNKVFVDLLQTLKQNNDCSADSIRKFLWKETAEASKWPDDQEFGKSWQ